METRVRVRFAETDAEGIAYHSNHLVWFEVARTELFRKASGQSPAPLFRTSGMPVTEATVRYHQPCGYDDELIVSIRVGQLRSRSVRFEYSIRHADGDGCLISEGHTTHVFVDSTGAPCRIPDDLRALLSEEQSEGDGHP